MTINVCVLHDKKAYAGSDEALSNNNSFTMNDVSVKLQKFSNSYSDDEFIVTIAGQLDYRKPHPCGYHFIELVKEQLQKRELEDSTISKWLEGLPPVLTRQNENPNDAPTYINIVYKGRDSSDYYTIWCCELNRKEFTSPEIHTILNTYDYEIVGGGDGWIKFDEKITPQNIVTIKDIFNYEYVKGVKSKEDLLIHWIKNSGRHITCTIKDILKFYAEVTDIPKRKGTGVSIEVKEMWG